MQRLLEKEISVFGAVEPARKWLTEKAFGLGDVSPLELASTEVGTIEVENLLGRIEHAWRSGFFDSADSKIKFLKCERKTP